MTPAATATTMSIECGFMFEKIPQLDAGSSDISEGDSASKKRLQQSLQPEDAERSSRSINKDLATARERLTDYEAQIR